jgi:hypothetical protein
MNGKDDRGAYDLLIEEGNYSGTRPRSDGTRLPLSAGRIRCSLFAAVGILLLVSIISSIIVLLTVGRPDSMLEELKPSPLDQELPFDNSWRFIPTTASALAPLDTTERPTLSEAFFSPECAEAWVATGTLCKQIIEGKITAEMRNALKLSIIHTWVNGSDERLIAWKEAVVQGQPPPTMRGKKRPGDAARHFRYLTFYQFFAMGYTEDRLRVRDHGELVHSMRSIMKSLRQEEIANLHLVTGDLPLRTEDGIPAGDIRIGQVPTWLDLQKVCSTTLRVHHHWDIFKMRVQGAIERNAKVWRESSLPTFNSIAIETQLVTLASELTDTILYVRSTTLVATPLLTSAIS